MAATRTQKKPAAQTPVTQQTETYPAIFRTMEGLARPNGPAQAVLWTEICHIWSRNFGKAMSKAHQEQITNLMEVYAGINGNGAGATVPATTTAAQEPPTVLTAAQKRAATVAARKLAAQQAAGATG